MLVEIIPPFHCYGCCSASIYVQLLTGLSWRITANTDSHDTFPETRCNKSSPSCCNLARHCESSGKGDQVSEGVVDVLHCQHSHYCRYTASKATGASDLVHARSCIYSRKIFLSLAHAHTRYHRPNMPSAHVDGFYRFDSRFDLSRDTNQQWDMTPPGEQTLFSGEPSGTSVRTLRAFRRLTDAINDYFVLPDEVCLDNTCWLVGEWGHAGRLVYACLGLTNEHGQTLVRYDANFRPLVYLVVTPWTINLDGILGGLSPQEACFQEHDWRRVVFYDEAVDKFRYAFRDSFPDRGIWSIEQRAYLPGYELHYRFIGIAQLLLWMYNMRFYAAQARSIILLIDLIETDAVAGSEEC